jgi:hypothetical protein
MSAAISTNNYNRPAENLIDGDRGSYIHSVHYNQDGWKGPDWIRLDLGADIVITKIAVVTNNPDAPRINGQILSVASGDPDGATSHARMTPQL